MDAKRQSVDERQVVVLHLEGLSAMEIEAITLGGQVFASHRLRAATPRGSCSSLRLWTQFFAIATGQSAWALLLTLSNLAFNLYPIQVLRLPPQRHAREQRGERRMTPEPLLWKRSAKSGAAAARRGRRGKRLTSTRGGAFAPMDVL